MKIELCHNGDYPGYRCIRVNDKWASPEQERFLIDLFGADGMHDLYDKIGAKKISEEHERWVGILKVTAEKSAG